MSGSVLIKISRKVPVGLTGKGLGPLALCHQSAKLRNTFFVTLPLEQKVCWVHEQIHILSDQRNGEWALHLWSHWLGMEELARLVK